jgi:succinyl-CoA synthetase beta subunit
MDLLEYQARDIFAKHGVPVKTALEAIGVRVGKTPSETAALVRAAVSSG